MSSARETPEHDWAEVDAYLAPTLLPEDETLELVLDENQAAGLPAIDVSPVQGALLSPLVRISGAKRVLELGTPSTWCSSTPTDPTTRTTRTGH